MSFFVLSGRVLFLSRCRFMLTYVLFQSFLFVFFHLKRIDIRKTRVILNEARQSAWDA